LLYRPKRRWRDGTTHILFEPVELIERLAALVPAPRTHLLKYHGVLAPCASWRARVVIGSAGGARSLLSDRPEPPRREGGAPPPGREGLRIVAAPKPDAPGDRSIEPEIPDRPVAVRTRPATVEGAQPARRRNRSWSELMRRVFDLEVLECPACGGRLRVLAAITKETAIRAILDCLGLPSRAPPTTAAAPASDDPLLVADLPFVDPC
jgi:hypothetical protein